MNRIFFLLCLVLITGVVKAQITPSPARAEGDGPYKQLIIRGAMLINGTGAPPIGPVDVVVKNNRIAKIVNVGSPGVPINPARRPVANPGDREIEAAGMYLLPGFIDMHGHIGEPGKKHDMPERKFALPLQWYTGPYL